MANPSHPTQPMKSAQDTAAKVGDKAQDTVGKMADKAKDALHTAADKARDAMHAVSDRAKDAASAVGDRAENMAGRVGTGMESLADTIRDKGPHGGTLGNVASRVADNLESGGKYLQEEGLGGMANDMADMIRRNPIPALLVGIGIGFLVARATSSRS